MGETKLVNEEITQVDLNKGVQHSCQLCPVALALMRAFPEALHVTVGADQAFVIDSDKKIWKAILIPELTGFIVAYDNYDHHMLKPFRFQQEFKRAENMA